MKELEESGEPETDYAFQTFKGTRLVNGHTIEQKAKGTLEFIFAHRFGRVNSGLYELYGLDDAYVRLGLDYGLTNSMSVGPAAGRGSGGRSEGSEFGVQGLESKVQNSEFGLEIWRPLESR